MPFVDNCYLIKHAQGWMLWDTGLTDAHRRDAGGPEAGRSEGDALVPAEDAGKPARAARRQAGGHQVRRGVAHPSRPRRQRRDVPAVDAAGAEGRVRLAERRLRRRPLQARASGDQARRRQGRVRRRQRDDHLDAGPHAGPSVAAGQAAEDRRAAAVRRRGALQVELGQSRRAGRQHRPGADQDLDAEDGRHHGEGKGHALDQPRQGAARQR